eukprot:PITA_27023
MNLISWNLRGLNGPGKLRILKNMIKMEKPQICFLQETKCNSDTLERILSKAWIGCQTVAVDASGSSGGLSIAWDAKVLSLTDFHASHHFIQANFHLLGTNMHGLLSNVYFPQYARKKADLLNTIESLNSHRIHSLWIAGGDYNMVTKLEEKLGGRNRLDQETNSFKDFINNASLIDMQFCNDNWIQIGGDITTSILPHSGSDHWPISLQWQHPGNVIGQPFRFEGFWLTHPDFKDFVQYTWKAFTPPEGSKMYQFQHKLKNLKYHLKHWNVEIFGNIFKEHQNLMKNLANLHQRIITEGHMADTLAEEQSIHTQLEERRKEEEILWKQKSRIRWLKEGERNTKFFHRTIVQRRMHNNIPFLQKQDGTRIEQHEEIEKEFLTHFKEVHQEQNMDRGPTIDRIIQHVLKLITEEHNELLLKPISTQEVDTTMSQLKEGKAPGRDGFTTTFFHSFWDMINNEV